jgi:hypothetical protein
VRDFELVKQEGRLIYRIQNHPDIWVSVAAGILMFLGWNSFEFLSGSRPFSFVSASIMAIATFAIMHFRVHEFAVDADDRGLRSLRPVKLWDDRDFLRAAELGQLEYRDQVREGVRIVKPRGLYSVSTAGVFCIAPGLRREDASDLRQALAQFLPVRAA